MGWPKICETKCLLWLLGHLFSEWKCDCDSKNCEVFVEISNADAGKVHSVVDRYVA